MAHFILQRVVTGSLVVYWMGMLIFPLPAKSPFLASVSVIHGERGFEPRSSVTRVSQTLAVFLRPLCWDGLYMTPKGIFPWHLQGIFPGCWYWEGKWGNSWVKMTVFRESKHWRKRKEFQLRPSKRKRKTGEKEGEGEGERGEVEATCCLDQVDSVVPDGDWGKGNTGGEWQVQGTGSKVGAAMHWTTWECNPYFVVTVNGSEWVKSLSCVRLCDLMDYSPPGSSIHGIFQARILWGAISIQGSNPGLPHCRQTLFHLSHQGSPNCKWKVTFKIVLDFKKLLKN